MASHDDDAPEVLAEDEDPTVLAHRVTDASTLERVAAVYRAGGWPASVDGDALTAPYSAPSAGPPPWHLYRLTLHTAVGVATAEPHGAPTGTSPTEPAGLRPSRLPAAVFRGDADAV